MTSLFLPTGFIPLLFHHPFVIKYNYPLIHVPLLSYDYPMLALRFYGGLPLWLPYFQPLIPGIRSLRSQTRRRTMELVGCARASRLRAVLESLHLSPGASGH